MFSRRRRRQNIATDLVSLKRKFVNRTWVAPWVKKNWLGTACSHELCSPGFDSASAEYGAFHWHGVGLCFLGVLIFFCDTGATFFKVLKTAQNDTKQIKKKKTCDKLLQRHRSNPIYPLYRYFLSRVGGEKVRTVWNNVMLAAGRFSKRRTSKLFVV